MAKPETYVGARLAESRVAPATVRPGPRQQEDDLWAIASGGGIAA
jgi:hypothetical protein